ncbi:DUF262 domain-containing protein [Olleya namhaensis]|uniref:DUF262 domain-containing protein n=1 Tax=Olleya namhaensis TaxID=1144750 RepID=UPI002493ADC8|nr:DUF262 domain-containing protein [Olleya namhaensis]
MTKNPPETTNGIQPVIITVEDLLLTNISIPKYQRPYKWSTKNIHQLIDDILTFKTKPAYRLGTVVYHQDKEGILNIVDGQQRTLTLILIALAIENNETLYKAAKKVYSSIPKLDLADNLKVSNQISKRNLRDNYREIAQRIKDFDVETTLFFYQRCQVVKVVLKDVSEAFQFFDSQNARGVDLAPHDLLKAFHLREMQNNVSEEKQTKIVETWENTAQKELESIFGYHIYRIRNWTNGKSARKFTKNDVAIFKGISPNVEEPYPFAAMYRISHFYIEGYNKDYNRNIDKNNMPYPFQLDQVIINGKRFFEMIHHYNKMINDIKDKINPNGTAKTIIDTLKIYDGKHRTGDKYVYNLFKCALIFYVDKFGFVDADRAIEKIFLWSYKVRLTHQNVQLATMDNYAIDYPFVFKRIREALKPNDFLNIRIDAIKRQDLKASKVEKLVTIFENLKYVN